MVKKNIRQKKRVFFSYNFFSRNRKGNILTENLLFVILNLVFIIILLLFVYLKMDNSASLEERYAKEIALALDSAKTGMIIHINMQDAIKLAEKDKIDTGSLVKIDGNIVTTHFRNQGTYSYSFFNDVKVEAYSDIKNGEYFFVIQ